MPRFRVHLIVSYSLDADNAYFPLDYTKSCILSVWSVIGHANVGHLVQVVWFTYQVLDSLLSHVEAWDDFSLEKWKVLLQFYTMSLLATTAMHVCPV